MLSFCNHWPAALDTAMAEVVQWPSHHIEVLLLSVTQLAESWK